MLAFASVLSVKADSLEDDNAKPLTRCFRHDITQQQTSSSSGNRLRCLCRVTLLRQSLSSQCFHLAGSRIYGEYLASPRGLGLVPTELTRLPPTGYCMLNH